LQPFAADAVAGQEATGVMRQAGCEAGGEELDRSGPDIGSTRVGRLIDEQLVSTHLHGVAIAAQRPHHQGVLHIPILMTESRLR